MRKVVVLLLLVFIISCTRNIIAPSSSSPIDKSALVKMKYQDFFNDEFELDYPLVIQYRSIEDEIAEGTTKANYYRVSALLESYLGNYFNSVELTDRAKLQPTEMMSFDSLGNMTKGIMYPERAYSEFNRKKTDSLYKQVDFYQFMESMEGPQVFSINESHAIALFRSTWYKLLPLLKEKGYKYLVLESLFHDEGRNHNNESFALKNEGLFCSEVLSGNIIRKARDLGFILVSYDAQGAGSQVIRDSISFANIVSQTFDIDKEAKIVLLAGHAHISEKPIGRLKNFGTQFNDIGINPLTIHQYTYYERNAPLDISIPTLLIPKDKDQKRRYDYELLLPKTKLIKGRPHWLFEMDRKAVLTPQEKISNLDFPCIVEAYFSNEPHEAVPLDRIELKNMKEEKYLALEKGTYRIVVTDKTGKKIEFILRA